MNTFSKVEKILFVFHTKTSGVVKSKFGDGYVVPIDMINHPDDLKRIEDLVKKYETKNPLYGKNKTLYLKVKYLMAADKKKFLDKGEEKIQVSFETKCILERDNIKYLIFNTNFFRESWL